MIVSPRRLVVYLCVLMSIAAMGATGWCMWMANSVGGDDNWGERGVGTFLFGVFMYWCAASNDDDLA